MSEQQMFMFSESPEPEPSVALTPEEKQARLRKLASECSICSLCPLHTGRTNSVFSDGNPEASIMIVGEGPGYYEDQSGTPFVGKSGQLLNKMLESMGLNRQKDVYIANIVKCRPPDNRKPTAKEMQSCFDYLKQQIAYVNPEILILTGATALQGVTGIKKPISKSRGEWIMWKGIYCMPIFHPAYLLRNDSRERNSPKWLTWQDLKSVSARHKENKTLKKY